MFTKQHFDAIAEALRVSRPSLLNAEARAQWHRDVSEITGVFRSNPRFDVERFRAAIFAKE